MGILAFRPPGLGSYLMKMTSSYWYEGLVAAAIEPYAADCDGVSAIGCETIFFWQHMNTLSRVGFKPGT